MSQLAGFGPALPEGIWILVRRPNYSATTACYIMLTFKELLFLQSVVQTFTWYTRTKNRITSIQINKFHSTAYARIPTHFRYSYIVSNSFLGQNSQPLIKKSNNILSSITIWQEWMKNNADRKKWTKSFKNEQIKANAMWVCLW